MQSEIEKVDIEKGNIRKEKEMKTHISNSYFLLKQQSHNCYYREQYVRADRSSVARKILLFIYHPLKRIHIYLRSRLNRLHNRYSFLDNIQILLVPTDICNV